MSADLTQAQQDLVIANARIADLEWTEVNLAQCEMALVDCESRMGLPDTGQTLCYDETEGDTVDCASDTCRGQDGLYTGCPPEGRFADNGDGTVTDNCTGLMWQKEAANVEVPWCGALAYCESLDFAGHDDWRLPNVRELNSILDYGRFNLAIDPVFGQVSHGHFWSSTL